MKLASRITIKAAAVFVTLFAAIAVAEAAFVPASTAMESLVAPQSTAMES
jgi:hypothetical protein